MLYGTPSRAAHRATDDGGLGQLIRTAGTTGQHRQPTPPLGLRVSIEPERTANWLTRGLAALIVLGVLGMIGFLAVAGERRDATSTAATADPLADRSGDPAPLGLAEVFPDTEQVPGTGYRVVVTHIDADCSSATVGRLGPLLAGHGCSQVVRAAVTAPRSDYQVTVGVFNLADAAGAAEVDAGLRRLVETGDGSFASMVDDPTGGPVGQVGWRTRGHYLLFCVITRPGGVLVTPDDPAATRITTDLVDGYLGESVLGRRGSSA
nr:hypothetical protein [uncultured Actinoplanes sp.]